MGYYDNVFTAQAHLADSGELSIEAQIDILHDFNVAEQIKVHELLGSDPAVAEFLYGQFSDAARASLERSGEFDEIYAEELFSTHLEEREMAMRSFEHAMAWSQRAGIYETLATVLAVGLAFAAWASLMDQTSWTRWLFTVVATLILIASLCSLSVHLITHEPLVEAAALARP